MALIAAFGMYDRPETAAALDRLWAKMRDHLRAMGQSAPQDLTRGDLAYMAGWTSPNLLISQTCSLPFRAKLSAQVALVATPDHGLEGCPAGYYRSVYVARKNGPKDLRAAAGLDFAYNDDLSHSGWAAPYADHAARGLELRPKVQTGSHRASARAVAQGQAGYASLDALSWALIARYDDFASNLVVIDATPPSPALPFITAKSRSPVPLRDALAASIAALSEADCQTLHLRGVTTVDQAAYLAQPIPPAPAAGQGASPLALRAHPQDI